MLVDTIDFDSPDDGLFQNIIIHILFKVKSHSLKHNNFISSEAAVFK